MNLCEWEIHTLINYKERGGLHTDAVIEKTQCFLELWRNHFSHVGINFLCTVWRFLCTIRAYVGVYTSRELSTVWDGGILFLWTIICLWFCKHSFLSPLIGLIKSWRPTPEAGEERQEGHQGREGTLGNWEAGGLTARDRWSQTYWDWVGGNKTCGKQAYTSINSCKSMCLYSSAGRSERVYQCSQTSCISQKTTSPRAWDLILVLKCSSILIQIAYAETMYSNKVCKQIKWSPCHVYMTVLTLVLKTDGEADSSLKGKKNNSWNEK